MKIYLEIYGNNGYDDSYKITSLDWNSLTEDSVGKQKTKEELMAILKRTSSGKEKIIVPLHDSGGRRDTASMLQDIIDYFKSQGYIFGILIYKIYNKVLK